MKVVQKIYLFGDSRIHGMKNAGVISDKNTIMKMVKAMIGLLKLLLMKQII